MKRIKEWLKQALCKHWNATLIRWHWLHDQNYEPRHVEVEFKCNECGKLVYMDFRGQSAKDWADVMGDYKQDGMPLYECRIKPPEGAKSITVFPCENEQVAGTYGQEGKPVD